MHKHIQRVFGSYSWPRRFAAWLNFRVQSTTRKQRVVCTSVAGLMLLAAVIPTAMIAINNQRYRLPASVKSIVGEPNKNLAAKIKFNAAENSWQFNQSGLPIDASSTKDSPLSIADGKNTHKSADMPSLDDLKAKLGGGGAKDESLYAVNMPTDGAKGVTYYDTNTNLSFDLVPQFHVSDGREVDGHIVYPSANGAKLIYTAKANGMKEDIVLDRPIGDELDYSYKLNLPEELTAKIQSDGSLGVFSPDPVLFGNISMSGDQDKEKILSARQTAAKDHLLFVLPAPVIVEAGNKPAKAPVKFVLSGDVLTVKAAGLKDLQYPLSIDPSVVVTSSSDFTAGNGDNIAYGTDQINRAKLTGATLDSWASTSAYADGGTAGIGSTAYNGYLYAAGGNNGGTMYDDVEYAQINGDGTIGTWASTTSLSTARTYHGFTVYNGYAYALGGSTTGWSIQSSTEYAPVNSNGTIGTWTSTTSLPTERTSANTVAYNGYMYLIGGLTNSGVVNSVLYAPIKADGSLGSWSTTNSFTTARCNPVSFAYNGRMYMIGGYNNSSSYYSDVQVANINADGTLGTWAATTSYTTARAGAFGGTYGGYAYLAGGTSTANGSGDAYGDTQYAQINADGTLGAWRTMSATLASDRFGGATSFYKGYTYAVGGVENGSGSRYVQYAAIKPAGATNSFGTVANNFTTARALVCSVAYNGYLYAIGGSTTDSSGNNVTTIQYTAITSSSGNVGSWSSTTALPESRGSAGCTTFGGYLYVVGGYTGTGGTGTALNTVRYAPINSNGTIGTWVTTAPTLPSTVVRGGVFTYATSSGTYLYSVGGDTLKTYYALLASNGSIGSWNTASYDISNSGHKYQAFAQVGKYLYIMGAWDTPGNQVVSTVQYTSIGSGGDIASWSNTTSLNTAIGYSNGTSVNGCIYAVGGKDSSTASLANVQYACPAADGTVSTWYNAPNLSVATTDMGVTSYNGYIYGVGGYTTSVQTTTQFAPVNNGGGGGISSWQQNSGIGSTLYGYGSAYYNGYFYVIGGDTSGSNTATASVRYAPLNSDGTIGSWTTTSSLNTARHSHATYALGGYMYVVGGGTTNGVQISSVEYAQINSNGTLGSWTTATGSLSTATKQLAHIDYNGYLYALGGNTGSPASTVYYASPASSGNISSWSTTTSLPYAVRNGSAAINNGYLYVVGGIDGSGRTGKAVFAQINSNGTLGSWAYASSMPVSGETAVVVANGTLYTLSIDGASCTTTSFMAPITASGHLGPFQQTGTVSDGICTSANGKARYLNGRLYLPLGNGNLNSTSISSIARIGNYSKLINLSGNYALAGITYGGTLPNGGLSNITYKEANNGATFGSSKNATSLTGSISGCSGTIDTKYVQLRTMLDDTYSSVYPDTNGTSANITDMTINYLSPRAETDKRLMHGKFFSSEVLQPLDTCGG